MAGRKKSFSTPTLVILIPAYNEAETLPAVLKSIPKRIRGIGSILTVVIDDGSQDKTAQIARQNKAILVQHKANQGVGQALQSGLEMALQLQADYVVTLDADGQFPARKIATLLKTLLQNKADVVVASRFLNPQLTPPMTHLKHLGNRAISWLISQILRQSFTDVTCGFRAYNQEAVLRLQLFGRFTYTQEMFVALAKQRLVVQEVPVAIIPTQRANGDSRVVKNIFDYSWRAVLILVRSLRDYKPGLFFGLPATALIVLGAVAGGTTLAHYLTTGSITPYKSLGVIALFSWLSALLIGLFALVADMFDRLRILQERSLYYQRREYYGLHNHETYEK